MKAALGSVLVTVTALIAQPAQLDAQGNWREVVRGQLTRFAATLTQRGYTAMAEPVMGNLRDDQNSYHDVALTSGGRYVIVGACDQDCTDVDLRIYAPNGDRVAQDIEVDDRPVLEFTAPATGRYRVQVLMATCNTSPCYWGFQVFAH